MVGSEEGALHKCSKTYNSQFLASYDGHAGAVYSVHWNGRHPDTFLSASADWTVRLWNSNRSRVCPCRPRAARLETLADSSPGDTKSTVELASPVQPKMWPAQVASTSSGSMASAVQLHGCAQDISQKRMWRCGGGCDDAEPSAQDGCMESLHKCVPLYFYLS